MAIDRYRHREFREDKKRSAREISDKMQEVMASIRDPNWIVEMRNAVIFALNGLIKSLDNDPDLVAVKAGIDQAVELKKTGDVPEARAEFLQAKQTLDDFIREKLERAIDVALKRKEAVWTADAERARKNKSRRAA